MERPVIGHNICYAFRVKIAFNSIIIYTILIKLFDWIYGPAHNDQYTQKYVINRKIFDGKCGLPGGKSEPIRRKRRAHLSPGNTAPLQPSHLGDD